MYVLEDITIPTPPVVQVLPPILQDADLNKGMGKLLKPTQLCIDVYGNRIYWGLLKPLLRRGYYNNWQAKKAAMQGTYRNYGWQYSAEQYVLRRSKDPKKYKDEVPENPEKAPFPKHITEKMKQRQAQKACRKFWRR